MDPRYVTFSETTALKVEILRAFQCGRGDRGSFAGHGTDWVSTSAFQAGSLIGVVAGGRSPDVGVRMLWADLIVVGRSGVASGSETHPLRRKAPEGQLNVAELFKLHCPRLWERRLETSATLAGAAAPTLAIRL